MENQNGPTVTATNTFSSCCSWRLCTTHQVAHGEKALPSASLATAGIFFCNPTLVSSWLIDSGATDHMTSNCHLFSTFSMFHKPIKVSLADGRYASALGKGSICLTLDSHFKMSFRFLLFLIICCPSIIYLNHLIEKSYLHLPNVYSRMQCWWMWLTMVPVKGNFTIFKKTSCCQSYIRLQ